MKTVSLTPTLLKMFIKEEAAKLGDMESTEDAAKDTDEVDADEYADALEKHIDFAKALKIEEARCTKRLRKIRETRARVLKKISAKLV